MEVPAAANVADLVRSAARVRPDGAALRYRAQQLSWRDLDAAVDRAAGGLRAHGIAPGERVALVLGNIPEFVVAYFGALRAGLVAVPINPGAPVPELRRVLVDCGARALVCQRGLLETARSAAVDTDVRLVAAVDMSETPEGVVAFDDLLAAGAESRLSPPDDPEALAVLLYTSGTSGMPRAAMLTHRALLANLDQCSRIVPPIVGSDDVVLLVLPLFHVFGLNGALGLVARHAATGVLVERFDPHDTLDVVVRHHVSVVVGAPPLYLAWSLVPQLVESFDTVRLAVSGAAPLSPEVAERILTTTGRPVLEGYGLTETAPVVTSTLMSEVPVPRSIGRPIPGVELRLLGDDGEPVDDGDPGEIVVRGPNLFSGYWPEGEGGPDSDGWFPTGDLAVADDNGDLFLVGRRRELILVSGFNVYPREVEAALEQHPDIDEAAVLGIPHPYTGESVKAFVVLRDGARLTADDVIDHAARRLARFKCPSTVEFLAELPHSANGKIAKGRLPGVGG